MTGKVQLFIYVSLALLGWMIVRHETIRQEMITAIVLILVSIVTVVLSLRWLSSER